MKNNIKEMKEYLIKTSIVEDSMENWFWSNDDSVKGIIKIINTTNNKSIVLYKRTIDQNFINFYNSKNTTKIIDIKKDIIILNEYYREQLKVEKNKEYILEITGATYFNKLFNSNWKHPNPSVSLSYKLSIVSLILGFLLSVVSIILSILSLK